MRRSAYLPRPRTLIYLGYASHILGATRRTAYLPIQHTPV